MIYEVIRSRDCPDDSEWRAEAIDYASEGECYATIFSGPKAEERAKEYARWKNEFYVLVLD